MSVFNSATTGLVFFQTAQFSPLQATYLGQQMSINLIGLGPSCFAQLIGALRVDRIDRDVSLKPEGDEQSVIGFDYARKLLGRRRNTQQKRFHGVQALMTMGKASCRHSLSRFIQHLNIMMRVRKSLVQHTTY